MILVLNSLRRIEIGMKYTYEECVELYNSLIDEEIKRAKEVIEAHKKQKIIVEGE